MLHFEHSQAHSPLSSKNNTHGPRVERSIEVIAMQHSTPIVFVVDDDISVRESLESLIRCEGWESETFASAQEFLVRPRTAAPSCLILDVALPGLSGLDLQKAIASDRKDMPIIFITGY